MEETNKKAPEAVEKDAKAKKPAKEKKSLGEKIAHFFRSYKSEMKKIVWCPWKQVRKNSLVVLVTVIAFAAVICLLDVALFQGITKLGTLI